MAKRIHPVVVATRVTQGERVLIDTAAAAEGVAVATLIRRIVVPEVCRRVSLSAMQVAEAAEQTASRPNRSP